MVAIPEINGLTQARKLAEAATMAMEYIALATRSELDAIEVQIEQIRVDEVDVTESLACIRDARARAAELDHDVSARAAALANRLSAASVPMREIGTDMDLSFQRVAQLINS